MLKVLSPGPIRGVFILGGQMDRIQKQSILLVIDTLEGQLQALRALLGLTDTGGPDMLIRGRSLDDGHYTSEAEDRELEEALKVAAQKDEMLQTIFQQASENPEG